MGTLDDREKVIEELRDPNCESVVLNSKFDRADYNAIAAELPNSAVKSVTIAGSLQKLSPQEIEKLLAALPESGVSELVIQPQANAEVLEQLQEILPKAENLTTLKIDCSGEGNGKASYQFIKSLPQSHITSFLVSGAEFGDDQIHELGSVLAQTKIERLDISSSWISVDGLDMFLSFIGDASLKKLSLRNMKCGGIAMKELAKQLPHTEIQELCLDNVNIHAEDMETLAASLPETNIRILKLPGNSIMRDKGVEALTSILPQTKIDWLNMNQTAITGKAMEALAQATVASGLKCLEVTAASSRGDDIVAPIIERLPCSSLLALDISSHDFDMERFAEILPQSGLNFLGIRNCRPVAQRKGFEAIYDVLEKTELIELDARNTMLTIDVAEEMVERIMDSQLTQLHYEASGHMLKQIISEAEHFCIVNAQKAKGLADKLLSGDDLWSEEEQAELVKRSNAVHEAIRDMIPKRYDGLISMHPKDASDMMIQSAIDGFQSGNLAEETVCRLAFKVASYNRAKEKLEEAGINVTLDQFAGEGGALYQDRFLCVGGARALFADASLWDNTEQVHHVLDSLSEAVVDSIDNKHQLMSAVSRKSAVNTRER